MQPITLVGNVAQYYALLLQAPEDHLLFEAAQTVKNRLPFEFALPCGNIFKLNSLDELIIGQDVPCPCGDPSHWFVKYKIIPSLDKRGVKEEKKMRFYWIDPVLRAKTRSRLFGFFRFNPCSCGCTKYSGWGFNLGIVGFNVRCS